MSGYTYSLTHSRSWNRTMVPPHVRRMFMLRDLIVYIHYIHIHTSYANMERRSRSNEGGPVGRDGVDSPSHMRHVAARFLTSRNFPFACYKRTCHRCPLPATAPHRAATVCTPRRKTRSMAGGPFHPKTPTHTTSLARTRESNLYARACVCSMCV